MHAFRSYEPAGPLARPASLLGTYPVPKLHLVGAPVPANPRSPIQWQPTPPPLQYGIDYTFMHRAGRQPVRWPPSSAITVRIAGPVTPDRLAALSDVITELRILTQLNLIISESRSSSLVPSQVPAGEIHVGYLTSSQLASLPGKRGNQAGLGGVSQSAAGWYACRRSRY